MEQVILQYNSLSGLGTVTIADSSNTILSTLSDVYHEKEEIRLNDLGELESNTTHEDNPFYDKNYCTTGNCSKCIMELQEGEVEYSRNPIFLKENYLVGHTQNYILSCMCRPKTDCVLNDVEQGKIEEYISTIRRPT